MIECNLRLVVSIAKHYANHVSRYWISSRKAT
jgi:hypothetical protein